MIQKIQNIRGQWRKSLSLLLCCVMCCGCVSGQSNRAPEGPVLQKGDHLILGSKGACDLGDIKLTIDDNGIVLLPLSQRLHLAELTLKTAEAQINSTFKPYFRNPDFFLTFGAADEEMKRYISVRGDFKRPGTYAWTNGMTAGRAIELAGGINHTAKIRRLHFIPSRGRSVEAIRLTEHYRIKEDVILHPGDLIYATEE